MTPMIDPRKRPYDPYGDPGDGPPPVPAGGPGEIPGLPMPPQVGPQGMPPAPMPQPDLPDPPPMPPPRFDEQGRSVHDGVVNGDNVNPGNQFPWQERNDQFGRPVVPQPDVLTPDGTGSQNMNDARNPDWFKSQYGKPDDSFWPVLSVKPMGGPQAPSPSGPPQAGPPQDPDLPAPPNIAAGGQPPQMPSAGQLPPPPPVPNGTGKQFIRRADAKPAGPTGDDSDPFPSTPAKSPTMQTAARAAAPASYNPVPKLNKPSTIQTIAGILASVFRPDIGDAIMHPGDNTAMRNYQRQAAADAAAVKQRHEDAQAEEQLAHARNLDEQTAEGKRADVQHFGKHNDGLFNRKTGQVLLPPSLESPEDYFTLTKDEIAGSHLKGNLPNGDLKVPRAAAGSIYKQLANPNAGHQPSATEQTLDATALGVATQAGIKVDLSKPILPQIAAANPKLAAKTADDFRRDPLSEDNKKFQAVAMQLLISQRRADQAPADPGEVSYYATKVSEDSKNYGLVPKHLKNAVASELAAKGMNINNLDAQTRDAATFARTALTHINSIQQMIDNLDAKHLLGPVMGRWNDFLTGKVGVGPEFGPLKTNIGLLNTAMGRVHGGARGGSSPAMMEHFKGMMNSGTMDAATLKNDMAVYKEWLTTYAGMAPGGPGSGSHSEPAPSENPSNPPPADPGENPYRKKING